MVLHGSNVKNEVPPAILDKGAEVFRAEGAEGHHKRCHGPLYVHRKAVDQVDDLSVLWPIVSMRFLGGHK